MRILKTEQYINEKLGIQPVTKDRLSKMKEGISVDENTRLFIEKYNLVWNTKTMSYDCDGDVEVSEDIVTEGKLKIRFGNVGGNFDCNANHLTTLEGTPQKVGGDFYCSFNELTTLEGAPKEVGVDFICTLNGLATLKGAPKKVGRYFDCNANQLTTLEGAPQEIGGDFNCNDNNLTTLKGAPKKVGGDFYCTDNKLTTLEGAPNEVGGDFYCSGNPNLVLPEDKPSWVKGEIIS